MVPKDKEISKVVFVAQHLSCRKHVKLIFYKNNRKPSFVTFSIIEPQHISGKNAPKIRGWIDQIFVTYSVVLIKMNFSSYLHLHRGPFIKNVINFLKFLTPLPLFVSSSLLINKLIKYDQLLTTLPP